MILTRLREGTADCHQALETALPLGSVTLTREQYTRVLHGFRGYFATWETAARLAAPASLASLVAERARTPLLDQDLVALGFPPNARLATGIAASVPDLSTPAALLGSMYVLEGSRLGGQSMVRGLESQLGLTPQHGLAFFYGFGPQTGSRWKAFCAVVEENVDGATIPLAVHAARTTFTSLHDWLARCDVAAAPRISDFETMP